MFVSAWLQDGWTPLLLGSDCGHDKVVAMLLAAKANIEAKDNVCFCFLVVERVCVCVCE